MNVDLEEITSEEAAAHATSVFIDVSRLLKGYVYSSRDWRWF